MRFAIVPLLLTLALRVTGAQTAVPVTGEPRHHAGLANDRVRVFDVVVPPGDTTLYHLHAVDYAYVVFGAAALVAQVAGAEPAPLILRDGEVRFTRGPLTHRVSNPSATPFHNLTIELPTDSSAMASALAPLAAEDSLVLDNDRIRVSYQRLAPGASGVLGTSARRLEIYLTGGVLEDADGSARSKQTVQRATYAWYDGGSLHRVRNPSASPLVVLTIEVK